MVKKVSSTRNLPSHSGGRGFTRDGLKAWGIAVLIFSAFVSLATAAVLTTMEMEKNKTGFKAIEVKTPISFIDRTYMREVDGKAKKADQRSLKTP